MMSFSSLALPEELNTSTHDLSLQFFEPLLSHATRYDRGVGYFSSSWLRINARGMVKFANNGGRARWIASPILEAADWEALRVGDEARRNAVLRTALQRSILDLAEVLERDTLSALAWMIADEIITFKLALPHNKLEHGIFHVKFGVLTDSQGSRVGFSGSYNDSVQGTRNYDDLTVFCEWRSLYEYNRIQALQRRFEHLWNDLEPNVQTFDLPEAARAQIVELRSHERPYPIPEWIRLHQSNNGPIPPDSSRLPSIPRHLTLYNYQSEAIAAWFDHTCKGLLEMATGTGKTITALAASVRLYQQEQQLAVIITVPYQHLVDQWKKEAISFGYSPVLAYLSKRRWIDLINAQIVEFNGGYRRVISVITTHTTFGSREFQKSIERISGPTLIIADEAHHLGAEQARLNYPQHILYRMALSATPDRWFDDAGTRALRTYFGETVFSFPLEKAIGFTLTPYYYFPHLVTLTDAEMEKYETLSLKIARLTNRDGTDYEQALKMLLIRRAQLLNNAEKKLETLANLVDQERHIEHALFYCAPGQIEKVLRLLGIEKGLIVHSFTAKESNTERQRLLRQFARGDLQGLVAMRCLDEGVDVPSTRTAYLLASSSNPREFIQRRGRILRRDETKDSSVIHDLIAVPPLHAPSEQHSRVSDAERNLMKRELARFAEFANSAANKHKALDSIWKVITQYELMDL
jgi:superfamily II DNA or RNA helicase